MKDWIIWPEVYEQLVQHFKICGETESGSDGFEIFMISSWSNTSMSEILSLSVRCNGGSGPIYAWFCGTVIEEIFDKNIYFKALALSIGWNNVWTSNFSGGKGLCLLFSLLNHFKILHHLPGGIDLLICATVFYFSFV